MAAKKIYLAHPAIRYREQSLGQVVQMQLSYQAKDVQVNGSYKQEYTLFKDLRH